MGKEVGMAEFKANCTRLLREVQHGGEALTVTARGKPVATVSPPGTPERKPFQSAFGLLKGTAYCDLDPEEFVVDPDWEAKWNAKWDERGFRAPAKP